MVDEYASMAGFALRAGNRAFCPPLRPSLRGSLRHRAQYSRDFHDIARRHRELELLVDPSQSAKHRLANATDRLVPAEVLFDALADHLTDPVAGMARSASIDRAAAALREVLCHVRRHVARPAVGDKTGRVVGLVRPSVFGCVPGVVSSIASAAWRSPIPSAWVTRVPTTRPERFSMSTWPW